MYISDEPSNKESERLVDRRVRKEDLIHIHNEQEYHVPPIQYLP